MYSALLLIGPTGTGKTPLGAYLAEHGLHGRKCHHFDFGEDLRDIASCEHHDQFTSDDISFIRDMLENGRLLEPSDFPIAEKLLQSFFATQHPGDTDLILLNGFPRHTAQADFISTVVTNCGAISLVTTADIVFARIAANSGGDRTTRADDSPQQVANKLEIFRERTAPLLTYCVDHDIPICELPVDVETQPIDLHATLEETDSFLMP